MGEFGPVDPYDPGTVAAMVAAATGADVRASEPISAGSDTLYRVWTAGDDAGGNGDGDAARDAGSARPVPESAPDLVLKAATFVDPEPFLVEPRLLRWVDAETSLPVPAVEGVVPAHDDLPAPWFVLEHRAGESPEGRARDLPLPVVERVARDAGRHLAELHAARAFDACGPIGVVDGEPVVLDPVGDAADLLADLLDGAVDRLDGGRFADLAPAIRERRGAILDHPARQPVLAHNDYRLGNLLIDAETGTTRAVLDWGGALALPAGWELAKVESFLSGYGAPDDDRRLAVRAALRAGYAERADPPTDPDARRRYLLCSFLLAARWFPEWHADAAPAERDRRAGRYREGIERLLAAL